MSAMMESLEGRELFSVSLTPAAPSPTPVPYPNTTIEVKKDKPTITPIVVIKTVDTSSTTLMQ
jgi:hypothetical protein